MNNEQLDGAEIVATPTERITDKELAELLKLRVTSEEFNLALDLQDARRERNDARSHAADFGAETEQLRAEVSHLETRLSASESSVKELEDQARELESNEVLASEVNRRREWRKKAEKYEAKCNALRDAVRKEAYSLVPNHSPELQIRERLLKLIEGGGDE